MTPPAGASRAARTPSAARRLRSVRPGPVVLDTSALLRWTLHPETLSDIARETITRALPDALVTVSAISLWEVALKSSRGQLVLGVSATEFARRLELVAGVTIEPVDTHTWLAAVALDWSHRDPADRVIVASAVRRNALLVTSDAVMGAYYERTVW